MITLSGRGVTVELPGAEFPDPSGNSLNQDLIRMQSGRIDVLNRNPFKVFRKDLRWETLRKVEYDALVSFIEDTMVGSQYTFDYSFFNAQDGTTEAYSDMRYISGLPGVLESEGFYDVAILLEKYL